MRISGVGSERAVVLGASSLTRDLTSLGTVLGVEGVMLGVEGVSGW